MRIRTSLGAALVAAAFSFATAPASAASLMTDAFLTNANQNIDFLDRSSRLALDNSENGKVKSFAHDEARDQTLTANAIDDWITADLGAQGVKTGRSVAIDASASPETKKIAAMSPTVGQEDIDNLEGLKGKDFDSIYRDRQATALAQLQDLYTAYAAHGDDPKLVAISKRELPKIKRAIVELGRL